MSGAKFANIRPGYVPRTKLAMPYKPKPPTEFQEAVNFASMCKRHEGLCPELKFLFAVPNGGHRSKASAGKAKAEGVKVGVPDYIWPRAVGNCPGLVIELKRIKGGSVSDDQRRTLDYFASQGWTAIVCKGWQEAWEAVKAHMQRFGMTQQQKAGL